MSHLFLNSPAWQRFVIYISLYSFLPLLSCLPFSSLIFSLLRRSSWIRIHGAFVAQGKKVSSLTRLVHALAGFPPCRTSCKRHVKFKSLPLSGQSSEKVPNHFQEMKLDKMQKWPLIITCLSLDILSQIVIHL